MMMTRTISNIPPHISTEWPPTEPSTESWHSVEKLINSEDQNIAHHHHFGYLNLNGHPNALTSTYNIQLIDGRFNEHTFELPISLYNGLQQEINTQRTQPYHYQKNHLYLRLGVNLNEEPVNYHLLALPFAIEVIEPLYQASYDFNDLIRLLERLNQIHHPAMKRFILSLFKQTEVMKRLVSLPASQDNHHAYPGGLLHHILEVTEIVQMLLKKYHTQFTQLEQEVTILAALLHDSGKTETLHLKDNTKEGTLAGIGYLIPHDFLNTDVLYPSIEELKKYSLPAANMLRHLLICRHAGKPCYFAGGKMIKMADEIDAEMAVRKQVFSQLPDYFYYTRKGGRVYHRLN